MKKAIKFASTFPESQALQCFYAIGTDREAYDKIKKLRDQITERMHKIWKRKRRPSKGRKRSPREMAAQDQRFARLLADRKGTTPEQELARLQARRAGIEPKRSSSEPETTPVVNWQEIAGRKQGWGWDELRKQSAPPVAATHPAYAPYEDEEDPEDRGGIVRTIKPGGRR